MNHFASNLYISKNSKIVNLPEHLFWEVMQPKGNMQCGLWLMHDGLIYIDYTSSVIGMLITSIGIDKSFSLTMTVIPVKRVSNDNSP